MSAEQEQEPEHYACNSKVGHFEKHYWTVTSKHDADRRFYYHHVCQRCEAMRDIYPNTAPHWRKKGGKGV